MRIDRARQASDVSVVVGLGVRDGDALTVRDTEEPNDMMRDAVGALLALRDAVGALLALRDLLVATLALCEAERVALCDGDTDGVTIVHCT